MRIKLGTPLTMSQIATAINGEKTNKNDPLIEYISTDSRLTETADLFIPIKGEKYDGENFAHEAKKRGAFTIGTKKQEFDIFVSDKSNALLKLAHYANKNLPIILYRIAISGSVGKSTTKEFLSLILSEKFSVHKTDGNKNNEIGMPLTLLSAPADSEALVIEMGMNHSGEIKKMSECLMPNLAIITNIGRAHIGNLGNRENIAKAKMEITAGISDGYAIIPYDEPLLSSLQNKITFSVGDRRADFCLEERSSEEVILYKNGVQFCQANFGIQEDHFKQCLAAACAAAVLCGLSKREISRGISRISRDNIQQFEVFREKWCFYADFYNASPESVKACIDGAQKLYPMQEKSLLLGDMLELGDESKNIHREIGEHISCDVFNNLFLFGKSAREIGHGALSNGFSAEKIFINTNITLPEVTSKQIRENCAVGEVILMKASRGIGLERVLNLFSNCQADKKQKERG